MLIHGKRFKTVNTNSVTLGSRVKFWLITAFVTPVTTLCSVLRTIRVLPIFTDTRDA